MNQINKSHSQHQSNLESIVSDKEQRLFHLKNKDCLLYYLASEPLRHIQFLLKIKNKWLTIGDINGLEANYLLDKGQEAVASDISTVFLNEVKNEGLVKEISCQNGENITFEENEFDYTICKEAFHHFPRAYLGLYEMIRVSGKAAILLTEPIDILSKMPLLLFIKNKLDLIHPNLINKLWKNHGHWLALRGNQGI